MRIVFFGSPAFALPSLEALIAAGHDIVAVVTQPDRPAGRGHGATPPPVKVAALARGLNVLQPERVGDPDAVEALRALDADVFVVAAYGQILRQRVLDLPRRGCLNVHASLLPRHRGASPIASAILAGDDETGVTIMEMVRGLDAGPMVARVREPISPFDTTGSLEERLSRAGAELLARVLEDWAAGHIDAEPQDEALVTYAPQLSRADAHIDWSLPAVDLWRRVRAFHPWPVAYTSFRGQELRIHEAWSVEGAPSQPPGTVLGVTALPPEANAGAEALAVQTGDGALALLRVQRSGGKAMSGLEFLRGQRDLVGAQLG
ncbi:MAG TPA: methionyl-tRNA formyltransferase [Dehalococcoidia bacterium]|nr:methionyl-tRNA formyltransferase [Dehalococcoidia bacterium]